ncbi:MAG: hypothetical protein KDA20_00205 [Phycisphaerales bacterium]|nr:hypothetical protein [Phycisphaerales bacterium]
MRVAVVIDADAETAVADFEELSCYFSTRWGGRYNAIVPARNGEISEAWKRLLIATDPDCIYALRGLSDDTSKWINRHIAPAIFQINARFPIEKALHAPSVFQRYTPTGIKSIPQAIARLARTHFQPLIQFIHGNAGNDIHGRFIAVNFGTLFNDLETIDALREAPYSDLGFDHYDGPKLSQLLLGNRHRGTFSPDDLSAWRAWPLTSEGGIYEHRFTVVVGDSLDDLLLFRAIRMSRHPLQRNRAVAWVPSMLANDKASLSQLRDWIDHNYSEGNQQTKQGLVVSCSEASASLAPIAEGLGKQWQLKFEAKDVPEGDLGLPGAPSFYPHASMWQDWAAPSGRSLSRNHLCDVSQGVAAVEVRLPDFLEGPSSQDCFMVDFTIPYIDESVSGDLIWQLPQRQGLAAAIFPSCPVRRIERTRLPCRAMSNREEPIYVHLPTPGGLFHNWMSQAGVGEVHLKRETRFTKCRVSDEGQFLGALVRLFGSPYQTAYILGDPFWGPALHQMVLGPKLSPGVTEQSVRRALLRMREQRPGLLAGLDVRSIEELQEHAGLDEAASYLAGSIQTSPRNAPGFTKNQLQTLFGTLGGKARKKNPEHGYWKYASWEHHEMNDELDSLIHRDILRMGTEFTCDRCLTKQWVYVDEIASTLTCSGCGAKNLLDSEPPWFYQVNTLAQEAIRRRGVVAVIQALEVVSSGMHSHTPAVLPSLDVFESGSKQPFTDLDLVCFVNGELVIGEVKSKVSGFDEEDVDKLAAVAIDLLPNRVLLAYPGDDELPENIQRLFEQYRDEQALEGVVWETKKLHWRYRDA